MSNLSSALRDIRARYVREDYVDHVKALLAGHLKETEPGAKVEDTKYFNHSAIPDFRLTWTTASEGKTERDIYLRSSYASLVASSDLDHVARREPVFLALDDRQEVSETHFELTHEQLETSASRTSGVLVTDAVALDKISGRESDNSSPLGSAVRENFLRGARGLVDEPVAKALTGATSGNVSELVREKFREDAVFRMERTAALVHWALNPDSAGAHDEDLERLLDGEMSVEELRSFLPWLLSLDKQPSESDFWRRLGSMFDLGRLESIASEIDQLDLTRLVSANLETWMAARSYLGVNVEFDEDKVERPKWMFQGGTLGYRFGDRHIRVGSNGRKLQGRGGSRAPKWNSLKPRLGGYDVNAVSLTGIERSVSVIANQPEDINRDIENLVESVRDDYYVDKIEVVLDGREPDTKVTAEVDFGDALVISNAGGQLGQLVRVAGNVIGPKLLRHDLSPASISPDHG